MTKTQKHFYRAAEEICGVTNIKNIIIGGNESSD